MLWAFLTKAIWHAISVRCLASRLASFDGRSASNKASRPLRGRATAQPVRRTESQIGRNADWTRWRRTLRRLRSSLDQSFDKRNAQTDLPSHSGAQAAAFRPDNGYRGPRRRATKAVGIIFVGPTTHQPHFGAQYSEPKPRQPA
jgi:hypothetical protein